MGWRRVRRPAIRGGVITIVNFPKSFIRDESGATSIKYALIAAVLGVSILGAAQTLKGIIGDKLTGTGTTLTGAQ